MDNNVTSIEKLFEKAEEYGTTTVELLKLNAIDKTAEIGSVLATQITIAIVVAMFIQMLTIGIALWLGDLLGNSYAGFFIIASVYSVFAVLFMAFKTKWMGTPVYNFIVDRLLTIKTS